MALTERLEILLPPEWAEKLSAAASEDAATKSGFARSVIIDYLRARESRDRAPADVRYA